MNQQFVLPQTAVKLREAGFPQGNTPYLWHKQKGAKVSLPKYGVIAGEEHWKIYKRNKHDISAFGDSHGYNRWVSAPTVEQAQAWAQRIKEERMEAGEAFEEFINLVMMVSEFVDKHDGGRDCG